MMCIKARSDGRIKCVEGTDTGEPYVILCGVTESDEIVPLRVDSDGKIIISV